LGGSFPNPTVASVGGVTAANVAAGAGSANAATNANTVSTIVKRDGSGNFAAATITANLTGNVTGTLTGNASTATSAASFTGSLVGDVSGTQGATVVANVGGLTAANVAAGAGLANAATNVNTVSTIVKRDGSGNFAAGTVTANLTGNVTGNLTGNVTGNVSGTATNVTGTVAVANGGTGATTLAANNVLLGNGTNTPLTVAPGANGNVLMSNGTTWASSASTTNWGTPGAIGATTPSSAAFTTLTTSGNVGIGTTSPNGILHIAGQTTIHGAGEGATPSAATIRGANASGTNIFGANLTIQASNGTGTGGSGAINFQTATAAATGTAADTLATVMTIASSGNVGIGTTAPTTLLELRGNSDAGARIGVIATSGNQNSGLQLVNNARSWLLQTQGSDSNKLYIADQTAAMARMVIDTNGNVGIGTTAPTANLEVNGSIKSPMWRAIQLFNATPGGLPLTSSSFTTGGGTLLIFASGAGYATNFQQIGMAIAVDSVTKGYAKTFTNETSSHKAFAANALVVSGIAAGSHTITLSAWNGTITNPDDFFSVTVLELPF
jgi:hypothetical protein